MTAKTKHPTRLLKIPEAAAYLAISERTLWTLINEGKLSCVRFGSQVTRVDLVDLDAFIREMKG